VASRFADIRATIGDLRKAGWTAVNQNASIPHSTAWWKLTSPLGQAFEADFGERNVWVISYKDGREGFDSPTLGEALFCLLKHYSKAKAN